MSAKSKSQISEVIDLLRKQGYITSYEAIEKFGATRLSGIIFILRERGFGIETEMVQGKIGMVIQQIMPSIALQKI